MRRVLPLLTLAAVTGCASLSPTTDESAGAEVSAGEAGSTAAPNATAQLMRQSRAQMAVGRNEEAAALLERALRIEPSNPWLWLELARASAADGDLPRATAHARRAIAVAGDDVEARDAAERYLDDLARR